MLWNRNKTFIYMMQHKNFMREEITNQYSEENSAKNFYKHNKESKNLV